MSMSEDDTPAAAYLRVAVQQGLCTLRGVDQLNSNDTPVPIVGRILFHPTSMLGVSLILV